MGVITAFALALGAILTAAISRQAGEEFKAWVPSIVDRLLVSAVKKLPKENKERFEEEWRSHLADIPGEVGKLICVFGFQKAVRGINGGVSYLERALAAVLLVAVSPLILLLCFLVLLSGGQLELSRAPFTKSENDQGFDVFIIRGNGFVFSVMHRYHLSDIPLLYNVARGHCSGQLLEADSWKRAFAYWFERFRVRLSVWFR